MPEELPNFVKIILIMSPPHPHPSPFNVNPLPPPDYVFLLKSHPGPSISTPFMKLSWNVVNPPITPPSPLHTISCVSVRVSGSDHPKKMKTTLKIKKCMNTLELTTHLLYSWYDIRLSYCWATLICSMIKS